MEVPAADRTCPKCDSGDYQFRSRKKIEELGKPEAVETKYRCKDCGNGWKAQTPV
jgi:DNA-directed RNA polymerase subunit M/transcription elongation factor TFIIS